VTDLFRRIPRATGGRVLGLNEALILVGRTFGMRYSIASMW